MLDRMFLAEEQHSLMKLRQELEEPSASTDPTNQVQMDPGAEQGPHPSEEYDEWACIQRELGCLSAEDSRQMSAQKRSAGSDFSRLDSLKKFRVDKHQKRADAQSYVQRAHFLASSHQQMAQHFAHTVHHNVHSSSNHSSGQTVYSDSDFGGDQQDEDVTQNNSIDEQVQSAIDSILNLQQNTNIDLDDAVSSILS